VSEGVAGRPDQPVLRRVAHLLSPYKHLLAVVGLAVVIAAGLTAVAPFITRAVFDQALFPTNAAGTIGHPDLRLLFWLAGGLVAIPLVSSLIGVAQTYLTTKVGNSAMADLRVALFAHLERMELAFFTSTRKSAIAELPTFVVIQVRVGTRRKRLQRRTQESLSEMTAITEESLGVSGVLLAKVFNRADAEVSRYRRENRRQTRLQLKNAMAGQMFFSVVSTFFGLTPAIIYIIAGLLLNGGTLIGGQILTAGTIVAFTTLQARLQQPLVQLMRVSLDVQTSFALFARLFEYLDLKPEITDEPGAVTLSKDDVTGSIELKDLWFRYPAPRVLPSVVAAASGGGRNVTATGYRARTRDYQVLEVPPPDRMDAAGAVVTIPLPGAGPDEELATVVNGEDVNGDGVISDDERWAIAGISLKVEPGQIAALVGPSGSGKTTLTYLIPRLYEATKGQVLLDGVDVKHITLASLMDIVGMVTQEPYLFHGTITENLRYARADATDAEIVQACKDANIHDRILSFADGYETITGERGFRLSGGEKQRLSIARVLIKDPKILILDEATSALDTTTERLVQEALERAMRHRTTVAIAHRLSTIMDADVIFGIQDGRLVEQGTHAELLAKGGLYATLYAEQFSEETSG